MSRASMIVAAGSEAAKMTSSALLDLINAERRQFGESDVRRNDFIARCKDELDGEHYETFVVTNPNGTESEVLRLTQDQCMLVSMRESKGVRRSVQAKLKAMATGVPQTLPDALRLAADLAEKAQIAAAERDEAIRTKALIGSRREASAMGKASAAVREMNRLKDQLGFNTRHATITAVENVTGGKYEWRPLRKWCQVHGVTPETIPDKRYGEVKAYPSDAWGEVYGVDLAEVFAVEVSA